jgi:Protein of unknown function (DUF1217)
MSGIVSGVNYSLLFGNSSTSNAATNILSIISNSGTTSNSTPSDFVSSGNPVLDLTLASQNETRDVAQQAKSASVVQAENAFTTAVAHATSITSALQNPAILQVLLTANGMSDQLPYPALAEKALMSNPDDDNSLANQLTDTRWQTLVKNYDFYNNGLSELKDPTVQSQLFQQYAQVTWMNSLDQATPGLSDALTFKQQASSITNVDQILGDPINRTVVLTALGIPEQVAYQDIGAQELAVSSRMDVSKLQDPNYVNSLTDQYLLTMQQQNQSSSSTSTSLLALSVKAAGLIA